MKSPTIPSHLYLPLHFAELCVTSAKEKQNITEQQPRRSCQPSHGKVEDSDKNLKEANMGEGGAGTTSSVFVRERGGGLEGSCCPEILKQKGGDKRSASPVLEKAFWLRRERDVIPLPSRSTVKQHEKSWKLVREKQRLYANQGPHQRSLVKPRTLSMVRLKATTGCYNSIVHVRGGF